jgi:hypothetical protein
MSNQQMSIDQLRAKLLEERGHNEAVVMRLSDRNQIITRAIAMLDNIHSGQIAMLSQIETLIASGPKLRPTPMGVTNIGDHGVLQQLLMNVAGEEQSQHNQHGPQQADTPAPNTPVAKRRKQSHRVATRIKSDDGFSHENFAIKLIAEHGGEDGSLRD